MSRSTLFSGRLSTAMVCSLTMQSHVEVIGKRRTPTSTGFSRLLCNDFHPVPTERAPLYVRETFALARGFVPARSLVSPLSAGTRAFSSFHGTTRQFVRDVHDGDVIVFFYKPACGPCAAIREKIFTAAGRLRTGTSTMGSKRPVVFESFSDSVEAVGEAAASSTAAGASPTDEMSPEDHAICEQLRKQLGIGAAAAAAGGDTGGMEDGKESPHRLRFVAVNTNENDRVTALHDVRSLPTFVAYHNGKIVGRAEGARESELLALVKALKQASMSNGTSRSHDDSQEL